MFRILHFILTFVVVFILAISISNNPRLIRTRYLIQLLIIEIAFAYFCIHSKINLLIIKYATILFNGLLYFSSIGTEFIFNNMQENKLAFFFLNILCPIMFISVITGILQYVKILPIIIRFIGNILSKINGMGKLESFNAVSSLILGHTNNFIIYKNILHKIPEHRIYTLGATAISTASLSVLGSYMMIIIPKYIVIAIILNMFNTFIVMSIINPYSVNKDEDIPILISTSHESFSFFEILEEYIVTGLKITGIITATLICFIALISFINSLFSILFGITFQDIMSYVFLPFAWLMGIPNQEIFKAANIMAIKLVSNEFVAMINLQKINDNLSSHSIGILSVFLVSFSNFTSIGIISGAVRGINKNKSKILSRYGLKILYVSILVSILSGSITGLVIE